MASIPLTGWWFTDAVRQVACPKCGQPAGHHCTTPKGRKAWPPHGERQEAVAAHFGSREPWTNDGTESRFDRLDRCNVKYAALLRQEGT